MLIFGKHGSGLKFDAELRFDGHNYQKCFFMRDLLSLNSWFLHIFLKGIYFAPSKYEAGFISAMHIDIEIEKTLSIVRKIIDKGI